MFKYFRPFANWPVNVAWPKFAAQQSAGTIAQVGEHRSCASLRVGDTQQQSAGVAKALGNATQNIFLFPFGNIVQHIEYYDNVAPGKMRVANITFFNVDESTERPSRAADIAWQKIDSAQLQPRWGCRPVDGPDA
jgi:hypothetical protein